MKSFIRPLLLGLLLFCRTAPAESNSVELTVDASRPGAEINLTRYALGQGGLSEKPMFDSHVNEIAQLHPQTIRVFIQEYFNLYPAKGQYHWETFDRFIETIRATGAKPILSLCFKPAALFPKIDQKAVHPTSYEEWEELIFQLVKHCQEEKKFGIEYWEVGNEPDIGEDGGCPFLFQKEDYLTHYRHTAAAIRRADPKAKVGGPALAWYKSDIADALIEHCAKEETPLDFFSWHVYSNDPGHFRKTIREVKAKLAKFPKLKNCEMIIDEWNMSLDKPNLDPAFQPAFILETTRAFQEEGLSRSAYYHLRDFNVDQAVFSKILSGPGAAFMARWWNTMPQYDGLWDHQGRVRPAYFAFKLLSLIRGHSIPVVGATGGIQAVAARDDHSLNLVLWNFPEANSNGMTQQVTVRFPASKEGHFRQVHLNPEASLNELELRRHGAVTELTDKPIQMTVPPYAIRWITIGR